MFVERRRKRSSYIGLSLHYWLQAIAQQHRLMALILADSAGLLVAASARGPEIEELAAVTPLLARNDDQGRNVVQRRNLPMAIASVPVDKLPFFLCAVGNTEENETSVNEAMAGVLRILATR